MRLQLAITADRGARIGLLLAGAALLSACSASLLPTPAPAPARFTLDAPAAPAGLAAGDTPRAAAAAAPVLLVALPRTASGYDGRGMLYLRRPNELQAFAFHEWVAPPAQMLAPLLVRTLQDSGSFRAVLLAPTAAVTDWQLETQVLRLHQDFTQRPSRVRLTLRAVLLDSASRQTLAWREFDTTVPATADDPVAGAQAAQRAAQSLVAELAAFCAQVKPSRTPSQPP